MKDSPKCPASSASKKIDRTKRSQKQHKTVFERHTLALRIPTGVNSHRHGAQKHRGGCIEHRVIQKLDRKSPRRNGRSESHRVPSIDACLRNLAAGSHGIESTVRPHVTEEDASSFAGVKNTPRRSGPDYHALSRTKMCDENAAGRDSRIEKNRDHYMLERGRVDATGVNDNSDGRTEDQKTVGWAVLNPQSEHDEILTSEEDEMLRLSQSSVQEQQSFERAAPELDGSPKRRKKQKKGVVKRQRASGMRQSSSDDGEVQHSQTNFQSARQEGKESKRLRTRASSQIVCDGEDGVVPSPERSKKLKKAQSFHTPSAKQDFVGDYDRRGRHDPESASSAEPLKNIVITVRCMDVPRHKRTNAKEKEHLEVEGELSSAADQDRSEPFSKAIPKNNGRLERKLAAGRAGEGTMHSPHEPYDASAHERDRTQQDGELVNPTKSTYDVRVFSGKGETEEKAMKNENSPPRQVKKSKRRRRHNLVASESSGQITPAAEDGYRLSEGALQMGRLLRQQLLASEMGDVDDSATSTEAAKGKGLSIAVHNPCDASIQSRPVLKDCDEREYQRTAENSLPTRNRLMPSGRESMAVEREVSKEPLDSEMPAEESGRCSQYVDDEFPLSERNQTVKKIAHGSLEVGEKVLEFPDSTKRKSRHGRRRKGRANRDQLKGADLHEVKREDEMNVTVPSSKEGNLLAPETTMLESSPSVQLIGQEPESGSKQPEETSRLHEEFGIPGSAPGDLSSRNRWNRRSRRQRGSPETLPPLVQSRPSQGQTKIPKKVSSQKGRATPSSIVEVTNGCHSMSRSAPGPLAVDQSESGPEQSSNILVGEEQEREVGGSERVLKTEQLSDSLSTPASKEELPDNKDIANFFVQRAERTASKEKRKQRDQSLWPVPRREHINGLVLDGSTLEVGTGQRQAGEPKLTEQTEKLNSGHAIDAKAAAEQKLDDLVDRSEIRKQSELLARRSRRSRRSRVGGAQRDRSLKALDELSDNETSKDQKCLPGPSSSTQPRSREIRVPKAQQKTHHMRTRTSSSPRAAHELSAVIDLTDIGDEDIAATDARVTEDDDAMADSLKELQHLSLEDKTRDITQRPRCKYLAPLSDDETKLATDLTTRTKRDTKIVTIAEARITLRGESFKRLRGTRWLDDEVINAYVSLINARNDAIFEDMEEEHRAGIPRAYVFNTYFFTRLCSGSSGFDYPGVQGWTKRAKVDILKRDIIMIPINLGNHHWVLSGLDMEHKEVMYLDSMHGPDTVDAISKLKRWVFEELHHKHGEEVAQEHDPDSWREVKHSYRIRRVGVVPEKLEPRDAKAGREARVPRQRDGGSCGVFTAKMADCLSLGIKVYFKQKDIPLIRRRMALDLFRGYVPL